MPKVTMIVDRRGDTKMDAEGFVGDACTTATKSFEDRLAGIEIKRDLKDEYFDNSATVGEHALDERM